MTEVTIQIIDARVPGLENQRVWFCAIRDGHIVGMASLNLDLDDWGWLNDLYVDPINRRQGIGWKLVEAAGAWVQRETVALGVCCGVNRDNLASLDLFRRLNYRHVYSYPDGGSYLFSLSLGREHVDHYLERSRATHHV